MTNITCEVCGTVSEKEQEPSPLPICNDPDCWLSYLMRQQGE